MEEKVLKSGSSRKRKFSGAKVPGSKRSGSEMARVVLELSERLQNQYTVS